MKLLQVRIRGLAPLSESRWFELGAGLNLFLFSEHVKRSNQSFLQILQTINPPYGLKIKKVFTELQETAKAIRDGQYTRRINPHKRTVAMAVFSATPSLVQELAAIDQNLYETDRIEVGRRLDYSRWINFVELASSARWSEVAGDIEQLLQQARLLQPGYAPPTSDWQLLKPADRITGQLEDDLASWLGKLPPQLQNNSKELITNCLTAVMRATHFQAAKKIVRTRLPLFVHLTPSTVPPADCAKQLDSFLLDLLQSQPEQPEALLHTMNEQLKILQLPELSLQIIKTQKNLSIKLNGHHPNSPESTAFTSLAPMTIFQAKTMLAIAYSRVTNRAEPIFLFTAPHGKRDPALEGFLCEFVMHLSSSYQCLYGCREKHIFPDGVADRSYDATETFLGQGEANS